MRTSSTRACALLALLTLAAAAGCQSPAASDGAGARLYPGYGAWQRPITTVSADAQRWFDQGLQLLYGFNHDEAIRSFRRATELDPGAPLPWFGIAYAYGIHVNNASMSEEANREAWHAAQEARARAHRGTPVEAALCEAIAHRYAWPAPENRRALDEAFAAQMEQVWSRFPQDPDVGAWFAESLMNLQPWDYWDAQKQPKGRALDIVRTIEAVLALAPLHPGALHFHVHALEASARPGDAEQSADRLSGLVPGSGHLVHMPSHIYVNVGRWADAADVNADAIAADVSYFAVAPPPRFYSLYFLHNVHFLAYAAMMEGRREVALAAARQIGRDVPQDFLRGSPQFADAFMSTELHVMMRFGMWEEILSVPEFADFQLLSTALRHFARCVALANLGLAAEARAEFARFDAAAAAVPAEWSMGVNPAASALAIARHLAEGEMLWREGRRQDAWDALRAAVAAQDALTYDEPPGWMQPARHALGALLLQGGRAVVAEEVFREDQRRNPANAWSLLGLEQALRAQGRDADADALRPSLEAAWARADVRPPAACYCAVE